MSKLSPASTYLGAGMLILTAAFHSYAFGSAADIANAETAHPFTAYFLEPLWLFPTVTWIGLAIAFILKPPRKFAILIALIPCLQAIVMFTFMGAFPGAIALGLAGGLLLTGSVLKTP